MPSLLEPLRVFISSKQAEFREERRAMAEVIARTPLLAPVVAEEWSPGRQEVRQKYLDDVRKSPIYVGLFGAVYSEHTLAEYEAARENPYREIMIYIKKQPADVDAQLAPWLETFQDRHVCKVFETAQDVLPFFEKHLWDAVRRMIEAYLELKEPEPVARGSSTSVLKRRWAARREQLLALGLPGTLSATSAADYADQLSAMLQETN